MRTFLVQKVMFINEGKELTPEWETTISTTTYEKAVQLAAFEYMNHITDINEITVQPLGLWIHLVTENSFTSLYRIENLDIE